MKIQFLQHVPFEDLGSMASWIKTKGYELHTVRLFKDEPIAKMENYDGLIVMGGPMGIYDYADYPWLVDEKKAIESAITGGKKTLGICLGAQLIADVLGSKVYKNKYKEIGWFPVEKTPEAQQCRIDSLLPQKPEVFHWHGDTFDTPKNAVRLYKSDVCENQAFIYDKNILALQFHLEMMYQNVKEIIKNAFNDLTPGPYVQSAVEMLDGQERFKRTNKMMNTILEYLF